jgi:hypothetical protein
MMTSGIVVHFKDDSPESASTVEAISTTLAFTLGEMRASGLSLALEAQDSAESERWLEWLRARDGVIGVEVVFVHWDDSQTEVSIAGT